MDERWLRRSQRSSLAVQRLKSTDSTRKPPTKLFALPNFPSCSFPFYRFDGAHKADRKPYRLLIFFVCVEGEGPRSRYALGEIELLNLTSRCK